MRSAPPPPRTDPARVLVVGAAGRVARALGRQSWPAGLQPRFMGRAQFDLCGEEDLEPILAGLGVDLVINTAAWTDVDAAEAEPEAARRLNRDGAARLARASAACGAGLLHLSTDYVFGAGTGPRSEEDEAAPLGVYGASKRAGEIEVLALNDRATVVRTSWLFDGLSANFLTAMLGLRARERLDVVADQQGSPTLTDHLAQGLIQLASLGRARRPRLLHFANQGGATRFEFAAHIFACLEDGRPIPALTPVSGDAWPAVAKRPADTRLSVKRWIEAGLPPPPPWREAVREGVEQWRGLKGDDR